MYDLIEMNKKYRKRVLFVLNSLKVQKHRFYGSLGANLLQKVLRARVIEQMLAHKPYVSVDEFILFKRMLGL